MSYLIIFCKIILFFISSLGFWEYFRRKSKMSIYFLPAFTICLQIMILFCGGILNCLEITVWMMFAAGLLTGVYYLWNDFKNVIDTYWNCGYIFFIVVFCVILCACQGQVFTAYDNFSHWGLIIKNMLLTDRFPSFLDSLIVFQEYPLGSASYIYYFAKLISESESAQMAAQGLMMMSFILPVFKYVHKNKVASCLMLLVYVNYIFCYNIRIDSLLVDTLLPLQGMATLFFVYSECLDFKNEKNPRGVCVSYAIPFLCTSVQIKNSGIYFAALACVLIGISLKNDKNGRKCKIITIAAPFLSLYLWKWHCNYVFVDGSLTKHAMTVQNYQKVFFQKTGEEIKSILSSVIKYSFSGKGFYYILLFLIIVGIMSILIDAQNKKAYTKLFFSSIFLYITYMIGIAFMYLFSMPGQEARDLAGIDRYRKTIFIAIYYLLMLFSVILVSSIRNMKKGWGYLVGIYLPLIIWLGEWRGESLPIIFHTDSGGTRLEIEQIIEENQIPSESSYMICVSTDNVASYVRYLCRYLLWSDDISVRVISEESEFDDIEKYQYVLIYDKDNKLIQNWIEDSYPDQQGKQAISIDK